MCSWIFRHELSINLILLFPNFCFKILVFIFLACYLMAISSKSSVMNKCECFFWIFKYLRYSSSSNLTKKPLHILFIGFEIENIIHYVVWHFLQKFKFLWLMKLCYQPLLVIMDHVIIAKCNLTSFNYWWSKLKAQQCYLLVCFYTLRTYILQKIFHSLV